MTLLRELSVSPTLQLALGSALARAEKTYPDHQIFKTGRQIRDLSRIFAIITLLALVLVTLCYTMSWNITSMKNTSIGLAAGSGALTLLVFGIFCNKISCMKQQIRFLSKNRSEASHKPL